MDSEMAGMGEVERQELANKLDQELEDYMNKLPKKPYKDGFTENIEEELEQHPAFNTSLPEGELPPLVEAMAQLKYDPAENTPQELAQNYKEDGNYNFKLKKYSWAITAYTEGIKQNCDSGELNAQLYTNRAASHFHLGNYRSSFNDCVSARKFLSNHMKAIVRGAECCFHLQRFTDAIDWCDQGLAINPTEQVLIDLRNNSEKVQKKADRDRRKAAAKERKERVEMSALMQAFNVRQVKIAGLTRPGVERGEKTPELVDLTPIDPIHPAAINYRVHLDPSGDLVWPVLLLYPEYSETDFIESFHENTRLIAQLDVIFSIKPGWDIEGKYSPDRLRVYFEDVEAAELCHVDKSKSLREILAGSRYTVCGGTPSFMVLVEGSAFQLAFLDKHKKV